MSRSAYHPWVVLHIPHDSTVIPDEVRSQFLLTDPDLALALRRMTDHFSAHDRSLDALAVCRALR